MKRAAEGYGDAGRRGGPKQGKSQRFGPHAFKVLCPEQMVAKMMGVQGGVVHQIESQTGSHLQFSPRGEYYPDTRLRVLTVHAPEVGLVMDALVELVEQVVVRADEEQQHGRSGGDFVDAAGNLVFRCALSKAAAGAIIGSKGERVRGIRDRTGCQLDIAREVVDSHQLCTVAGEKRQLLSVLDELNATVQEDVDAPWFAEWAEQRGIAPVAAVDSAGPRRGGSRPPASYSAPPPSSKGGGGGRSEEHINCTIFVGHLAQATDTERLRSYFSRYGRVVDADVRTDPSTGRSKGFGFITFADPNMAEDVLAAYGEHEIDGRRVDVKRYNETGGGGGGGAPRDEDDRGHHRGPPPRDDRGPPMERGPPRDDHYDRNGYGGGHGGHGGGRSDPRDHRDFRSGGGDLDWFAGLAGQVPPDYLGLDYCICCSLPGTKIGALIGRGGEHVAEVQRVTGAQVSVAKKAPNEGIEAFRQVTITGQLLSVYAAHLLLMKHYNDEEAQFAAATSGGDRDRDRHHRGGGGGGGGGGSAREIEDLQRQLSVLSQELNRVRSGPPPGPGRRRSPPPSGRPRR